ncbi:MAG: GtrA family protein [Roseburia sp.]|nr:GtrA family protein [Roseburia sp.]
MEERKDIFDKIMMLPGLRILNPFYKKNKEVLLYLFFGGLTFLVSVISYAYFNVTLGINELVANIISWVLAVAFAFFTNRIWVFQAPTKTVSQFLMQLIRFFMGRVATLVVEEVILLVFITILGFNSMVVKVIAQVIVIVLNYVISKLVVFRKKNDQI